MTISATDIKRIVEESFLKSDHKFEFPPVCLGISGEYGTQTYATLGNFSTLLAPPKVGKTTATGVLVSALLTGNPISRFVPSLPDNKKVVVWIDNEQGKPECVKTIRNICSQVTGNKEEHPQNLIFCSLRQYNKETRIAATEYIIQNTPNIGFLVIDGIRDFVSSINDEREATAIADYLLKWTQEFNIHIFTILHQNKGDDNARGHLGTELMNKAETVATLIRDDSTGKRATVFKSKFTRHKDFEEFAFSIDDNGNVTGSEIQRTYDPINPTVSQLTYIQLETLVSFCFSKHKYLSAGKLWPEIKLGLEKDGIKFGDNKSKDVMKRLAKENYIIYDDNIKSYYTNIPV